MMKLHRSHLKTSPHSRFLSWVDNNEPFFYLADTWWFGMSDRCSLKEFEELAKDRSQKGFTAIQIVVGAPPEIEVGMPFNPDRSLNEAYFAAADKKIAILLKYNLVPCIVGSWGHHMDILGREPLMALWKEIVKRYSQYPVMWCICGEADIPFRGIPTIQKIPEPLYQLVKKIYKYLSRQKTDSHITNRLAKWAAIAEMVKKTDPHHNPITIHTHSPQRAMQLFNNPAWLAIDSIQTGHTIESQPLIRQASLEAARHNIPFINLEPWYEGIGGNFFDQYQRYAFWVSVLSGASGHTYGAHGVWNMARGDNFLGHWGNADWKMAMEYKGSTQLGKAVQFLTSIKNWETLHPRAEGQFPQATTKDGYTIGYIPNINEMAIPAGAVLHNPESLEIISSVSELKKTSDIVITINSATIEP